MASPAPDPLNTSTEYTADGFDTSSPKKPAALSVPPSEPSTDQKHPELPSPDKSDPPDVIIRKLRQQNDFLREQLKDISKKLDENLGLKKPKKLRPREVQEQAPVTEQEHKNVLKLMDILKRDNEVLRKQMNASMDPDKYSTLQQKIAEKDVKIKDLTEEIRTLKAEMRRMGREVETAADVNQDYPARIDTLQSELRCLKEKLLQHQKRHQLDEKAMRAQQEHMVALETKCRKLQNDIKAYETAAAAHAGAPPTTVDESQPVDQQLESQKRLREEERKRLERALGHTAHKVEELKAQIDSLQQQLKEKDAELRLFSQTRTTNALALPKSLYKTAKAKIGQPVKLEQLAPRGTGDSSSGASRLPPASGSSSAASTSANTPSLPAAGQPQPQPQPRLSKSKITPPKPASVSTSGSGGAAAGAAAGEEKDKEQTKQKKAKRQSSAGGAKKKEGDSAAVAAAAAAPAKKDKRKEKAKDKEGEKEKEKDKGAKDVPAQPNKKDAKEGKDQNPPQPPAAATAPPAAAAPPPPPPAAAAVETDPLADLGSPTKGGAGGDYEDDFADMSVGSPKR